MNSCQISDSTALGTHEESLEPSFLGLYSNCDAYERAHYCSAQLQRDIFIARSPEPDYTPLTGDWFLYMARSFGRLTVFVRIPREESQPIYSLCSAGKWLRASSACRIYSGHFPTQTARSSCQARYRPRCILTWNELESSQSLSLESTVPHYLVFCISRTRADGGAQTSRSDGSPPTIGLILQTCHLSHLT